MDEVPTLRASVSDGTNIFYLVVIEHMREYWLVPDWLISQDQQFLRPTRIICMTGMRYTDHRGNNVIHHDFSVNEPIPRAVLDGVAQPALAAKYKTLELPNLTFRKPAIH